MQFGEHPVLKLFQSALFPGVMEEVLYRGLLFGLLFRFARWGFIPAALVGAALFGAGHLYQGDSMGSAAASFAVTAMGAFWFAWLYVEWRNNLWVPIGFHVLMNLYWILFSMGETAVGGTTANIYRIATILLSVALTLIFARRKGNSELSGRRWIRG
jgi:membrane protease YdiL (CAAX protease family)